MDPFMSPLLTSLGAVDVVRRYNACVRYSWSHAPHDRASEGFGAVVHAECKTLEEVAKSIVNKYPRAPAMDQRRCLVTLASMENLEIVRDLVNTLGSQIAASTAVR